MVSLGRVTTFLVSKCSNWKHATNLGLTPHVHPSVYYKFNNDSFYLARNRRGRLLIRCHESSLFCRRRGKPGMILSVHVFVFVLVCSIVCFMIDSYCFCCYWPEEPTREWRGHFFLSNHHVERPRLTARLVHRFCPGVWWGLWVLVGSVVGVKGPQMV